MSVTDLLPVLNGGGVVGLLCLILLGGYRRWWVWGWAYRDLESRLRAAEADREEWKFMALTGTQTARSAVSQLEQRRSHEPA